MYHVGIWYMVCIKHSVWYVGCRVYVKEWGVHPGERRVRVFEEAELPALTRATPVA